MSKPCRVKGCAEPRMVNRAGKELTMCEAHQREYWRRAKTGSVKTVTRAAQEDDDLFIRVQAQRCEICQTKKVLGDFAPGAKICRACVSASEQQRPVTIIDPLTHTVRYGKLLLLEATPQPITDHYGLFVLHEKERGALVVVEG